MPKYMYPENLIHFCRPVLEHYELDDEMGRMFVRSMYGARCIQNASLVAVKVQVDLYRRSATFALTFALQIADLHSRTLLPP